jgi:mRNA interferase MazF
VVYCAGPKFFGKERPAVIVQSDKYNQDPASYTVCLLTGDVQTDSAVRVTIEPTKANGLGKVSQVMVDKVMSLPVDRIKNRVGTLNQRQMARIDAALRDWLDV